MAFGENREINSPTASSFQTCNLTPAIKCPYGLTYFFDRPLLEINTPVSSGGFLRINRMYISLILSEFLIMNNKVVALSILYAMSSYAASNDPVITQPYRPSISPFLTAAFLAVDADANHQQADGVRLNASSVPVFKQMMKKQSVLDTLLTRPQAVLESSNKIRKQYEKETPEDSQKNIARLAEKHPLFLLNE